MCWQTREICWVRIVSGCVQWFTQMSGIIATAF